MDEVEGLVDCPRCNGFGFLGEKLCLCLAEQSKGWSPGKLPESIAAAIRGEK